jgi:hypothetical protein
MKNTLSNNKSRFLSILLSWPQSSRQSLFTPKTAIYLLRLMATIKISAVQSSNIRRLERR